jgi:hypothetical protein
VPLSATFSLAFLHHGTQVLFLPTLLLALWLAQKRWQDLALFCAISLALVGLPYLLVGTAVKGITSLDGYFSWATAAPGVGVWGKLELLNIWRGSKTFVNSIAYSGGGPDVRSIGAGSIDLGNMASLLIFAVIMIVVVITALYLAREWRRYRYILLVCVPWALTYAVFALYWAPEDAQFWVGALAPFFILMAIALRGLSGQSGLLRGLIVVGVLAVLAANLATTILPRRDLSGNVAYAKASCLSEYTEDADLVITPGWDWAGSYMPYFFGSDVFSIVDSYVMAADRNSEALMDLLNSRIKEAQSRGGRVYVARLFTLSDDDLVWLQRATGLSPQDFSLPGKEAFRCADEPVWELEP